MEISVFRKLVKKQNPQVDNIKIVSTFNKYRDQIEKMLNHITEVRRLCSIAGVPGLGESHDLDKFDLERFMPYYEYHRRTKPNVHESITPELVKEYNDVRKLHRDNSLHHVDHWDKDGRLMPLKYLIELIADWIAASKQSGGYELGVQGNWDPDKLNEFFASKCSGALSENDNSDRVRRCIMVICDKGEHDGMAELGNLFNDNKDIDDYSGSKVVNV